MKTLMTTALLAALAITGFAKGDEPGKATEPAPDKPAVKKVTMEELETALERMGYTPKPLKDKNGKIVSFEIQFTRGSATIPVTLDLSGSQTRVWLHVGVVVLDEKYPATQELLLEFLGKHDELWPAYLVYYPGSKYVRLSMSMDIANFGPATLRPQLEKMFDKALIVVDAMKKAQAAAKKAKEVGKGEPNPLP